jgi:cytosine/adenosine deaminase-related metal-dependent hydrolase
MTGPEISHGAVAVAGNRIVAVGPNSKVCDLQRSGGLGPGPLQHFDYGSGVIIPALVNTHVHLEFTPLQGAIPPQTNLPDWLQAALAGSASLAPDRVDHGVRQGLAEMRRFGTNLVGEVSNTGRSLPLLAASNLDFHFFYECLGFDLLSLAPLAEDLPFFAQPSLNSLPVSAAAHAPYSVSAPLFRRLKAWNQAQARPTSVHLAESQEEIDFLRQGDGPFRDLLVQRGRWYEDYTPPGFSPAVYLDILGFWDELTLAVHGVWLDEPDRVLLARRGVWLALCPRSNLHTGAGFPDLPALQRAGLRLTLGTDSLASTPDLNLFQEIKLLHNRFPQVHLSHILAMATRHGAAALNRGHDLGTLEPGKKAAMLFLPLAPGEPVWPGLLASGVQGRIFWLTPNGKEFSHGA